MPPPAPLGVRHHTFLQSVMSRGPLSEEMTHGIYKSILKVNSLDGFNSFLGELNKELEFVDLEVKKVTNQNEGKEYFGMINKVANPQAKLGTRYSTAQISFFKAVMEAIVLDSSGQGYIHSSKALNLKPSEALQVDSTQATGSQVGVPVRMTLGAKEEALELLVKDQWLSRTHEGGVALGTRAFLELRGLFRNFGVVFCEVCNEAAIKAELCQNHECSVRMHSYCVAKKFRARQARECSSCQTVWATAGAENGNAAENPHYEECQDARRGLLPSRGNTHRHNAIRERPETENRISQPTQSSQNSRRNKAAVKSFGEEEDSASEEEITRLDSEKESPRPRKRRSRKRD